MAKILLDETEEVIFEIGYDKKPFKIEIKSFWGIIKKRENVLKRKIYYSNTPSNWRVTLIYFCMFWKINSNNILHNYAENLKIEVCANKKLPADALYYFEDAVVHFEKVHKIDSFQYFIKKSVNKTKMLNNSEIFEM